MNMASTRALLATQTAQPEASPYRRSYAFMGGANRLGEPLSCCLCNGAAARETLALHSRFSGRGRAACPVKPLRRRVSRAVSFVQKIVLLVVLSGISILIPSACRSADTYWNVNSGDWSTGGNWNNGEPAVDDMAYIDNGGTATVTQVGEVCARLYCQTGGFHMVSGSLSMSNMYFGFYEGQHGRGRQDGGYVVVERPGSGPYFDLGRVAGSTGTYILTGGTLTVMTNSGWGGEYIGGRNDLGGCGHFIQTGGTNITSLKLGMGVQGIYDLSNGYFQAAIGAPGNRNGTINPNGTLNQWGGRFSTTYGGIVIRGTYNLMRGEMYYYIPWDPVRIAAGGVVNMGDTNGTGRIWGANGWMWIYVDGTLRGWGTNSCTGQWRMSGRVIADGWPGTGVDRTLRISDFTDLQYLDENTTSNGYYAVNRGRLILSPVTVPVGTTTQCWGDAQADMTNDLVNSIRMSFTNVTTGGTVTNALMALDRSDVPPFRGGVSAISVWHMTQSSSLAFDCLHLAFRYDDDARVAADIDTSKLTLWRSAGGGWRSVPCSVNTVDKLVFANIDTLGQNELFAIGSPPPSGTVIYCW